ncbi:MAG: deoxyribose-phosphate aldolase, partial [Clostridia bacterium]|nr:deoxyribose-phosphate aldolase [Clostridia bacterium]
VIGFPLGRNLTETKVAETKAAFDLGCDEFDMVLNVGRLKDGDTEYVKREIAAVVEAAGGRLVKVIIETGLLSDEEKVLATRLACEAGAGFVKTCSGVSAGVATPEDVALMKRNCTNGVKVKASSGIKTFEAAKALIEAGAERLGTSSGAAILDGAGSNLTI